MCNGPGCLVAVFKIADLNRSVFFVKQKMGKDLFKDLKRNC